MSVLINPNFRRGPKPYNLIFASVSACLFWVTISIPYIYDQSNLEDFLKARKSNSLLIKEYSDKQLELEFLSSQQKSQEDPTFSENKTNKSQKAFEFLKDRKIISLDYIKQMNAVEKLRNTITFGWSAALGLLLGIFIFLDLLYMQNHFIKALLVAIFFMLTLIIMWLIGLPHVNMKFHLIIGTFYSLILATSDFLYTLDLKLEIYKPNFNDPRYVGYLSSLQYKHRFFCVIFNLVIVILITFIGTIGFKTLDFFYKIFGDSFVTKPLIGLSLASAIAILFISIGVLLPLRGHIARIEDAMIRNV